MTTSILRDTNFSFVKTTTKESGESFSRKLEKGSTEYGNACMTFHQNGVALQVGNSVEKSNPAPKMDNSNNFDSMAIAEAVANKREDLFSPQAYNRISNHIYDAWDEDKRNDLVEGDEPDWNYRKNHVETELNQVTESWEDVIESYKG